jgi:transcriptional regulator with XRE-family HTH domain
METELAALLRERINTAYGGNQSEFSRATGFSPQAVSAWLKGKVTLPQIDARRRLARELGISHVDLLIAAGELTRQEAESGGIQSRGEFHGIPPAVASILREIEDWREWQVDYMVDTVKNLISLTKAIGEGDRYNRIMTEQTVETTLVNDGNEE